MSEPTNVIWKVTAQAEGADSVDRLANNFDRMADAEDEAKQKAEEFERSTRKAGDTAARAGTQVDTAEKKVRTMGTSLKSAALNFAAFAGIDATVRGAFRVIENGVGTITSFEEELANLSSLTGATGGDLEFLAEQARGVGTSTTVAASDALRAFTAIGSARPDLLANKEALAQVTKESIALSEAAKIDLATAGKAVAGAMNQFGLGAGEASRIVNVLAAGSKEGAADVGVLGESIDKVGTVLAANNITLEQGVGLLETLADKELKGAQAGTQLRNVVLRLVQAGKGFSTGQFDINEALEQTRAEFAAIEDPIVRAEASIKMFGLESVTAGNILLDNVGRYQDLTDAVTGSSVAYDQQATNTNTVNAALARLRNTIDSVFLAFGNSTGIMRRSLDFVSRNLIGFLKLVAAVGAAVLTYVTYTRTAALVSTGYASVVRALGVAKAFLSGGVKGATAAMQGFNTAVKANPIGLLLSVVALATTAFFAFADSADEAAQGQRKVNEERQRALEIERELRKTDQSIAGRVSNRQQLSKDQLESLKQEIDQQVAEYERLGAEALVAEQQASKDIIAERERRNDLVLANEQALQSEADAQRRFDLDLLNKQAQDAEDFKRTVRRTTNQAVTADDAKANAERLRNFAKSVQDEINLRGAATDAAIESLETLEKRRQQLQQQRDQAPIGSGEAAQANRELESVTARIDAAKRAFDGVTRGSLKELQEQRDRLLRRLQENLVFGSEAYAKTFDDYVKAARAAKEAEEKLKLPEDKAVEGSILFFEQQLAALNEQVKNLPEGTEFDELAQRIAAADAKLQALRGKLRVGDPGEDAKRAKDTNLAVLAEEERHALAISELDKDTQTTRLKLEIDFQRRRLQILVDSGAATDQEIQAQRNKLRELEFSLGITTRDEDAAARQELVNEVLDISQTIATAGINAWSAWTEAAIASSEAQIQAQERRLEETLRIAERGNAVLYEEEKKRMERLTAERKRQAAQQALIAQTEVFANSAVAVARAAAEGGGVASAITIGATVLALIAGLARARTVSSGLSFYKGGSVDWRNALSPHGGYTGTGPATAESMALGRKPYTYHRREYIMPHDVVSIGDNLNIFRQIHRGRMDLSRMLRPVVHIAGGGPGGPDPLMPQLIRAVESIPSPYFSVDARGFTYGIVRRGERLAALKRKR